MKSTVETEQEAHDIRIRWSGHPEDVARPSRGLQSFNYCLLVPGLVSLIMAGAYGLRSLPLQQHCMFSQPTNKQATRAKRLSQNETLYLNNSIGYEMLLESFAKQHSKHYFDLQKGFDTQNNQMYCAVASAATILNSLRAYRSVKEHLRQATSDLPSYMTQEDVFNACTNKNVVLRDEEFDGIFAVPYGLNLLQAAELLKCHLPSNTWDVRSQFVRKEEIGLDQMRHDLSQALKKKDQRVLVNFDRVGLHQEGGGHVSPVAAYSESADAFLILDVSKYKYDPVWAPAVLLYQAMTAEDACGRWDFPVAQTRLQKPLLHPRNWIQHHKAFEVLNCKSTSRGYIVVSRKE